MASSVLFGTNGLAGVARCSLMAVQKRIVLGMGRQGWISLAACFLHEIGWGWLAAERFLSLLPGKAELEGSAFSIHSSMPILKRDDTGPT